MRIPELGSPGLMWQLKDFNVGELHPRVYKGAVGAPAVTYTLGNRDKGESENGACNSISIVLEQLSQKVFL